MQGEVGMTDLYFNC
ncbi:80039446-86f5-4cfb-8c54-d434834e5325 [Thermothielavioides terrestris]|uniref:80039446-86f5-4cfb-8c54-d434834e5325 n=1 Tax=Thermothielavioides terrestris TaxID=2587410 RepID=A0A446BR38_9PEZI|nr:80039446-86f5-4cfb-8c54-d434834e5325 [Thermothielavioides terrestris]